MEGSMSKKAPIDENIKDDGKEPLDEKTTGPLQAVTQARGGAQV